MILERPKRGQVDEPNIITGHKGVFETLTEEEVLFFFLIFAKIFDQSSKFFYENVSKSTKMSRKFWSKKGDFANTRRDVKSF